MERSCQHLQYLSHHLCCKPFFSTLLFVLSCIIGQNKNEVGQSFLLLFHADLDLCDGGEYELPELGQD